MKTTCRGMVVVMVFFCLSTASFLLLQKLKLVFSLHVFLIIKLAVCLFSSSATWPSFPPGIGSLPCVPLLPSSLPQASHHSGISI